MYRNHLDILVKHTQTLETPVEIHNKPLNMQQLIKNKFEETEIEHIAMPARKPKKERRRATRASRRSQSSSALARASRISACGTS